MRRFRYWRPLLGSMLSIENSPHPGARWRLPYRLCALLLLRCASPCLPRINIIPADHEIYSFSRAWPASIGTQFLHHHHPPTPLISHLFLCLRSTSVSIQSLSRSSAPLVLVYEDASSPYHRTRGHASSMRHGHSMERSGAIEPRGSGEGYNPRPSAQRQGAHPSQRCRTQQGPNRTTECDSNCPSMAGTCRTHRRQPDQDNYVVRFVGSASRAGMKEQAPSFASPNCMLSACRDCALIIA